MNKKIEDINNKNNPISENRVGKFSIVNISNFKIKEVYVRHTANGQKGTSGKFYDVFQLQSTPPTTFYYEVGPFSSFDYWYIEVMTEFNKYKSKDNFYCSISSDDEEGNVLILIRTGGSSDKLSANVNFSYSSECSVDLNKE